MSWNAYTHFSEAVGKVLCMTSPSTENILFPDIVCLQEVTDNVLSSQKNTYSLHLINQLTMVVTERTDKTFVVTFVQKIVASRALRSVEPVGFQLPRYMGFVAEQTSYAPKVETHYKNLYILVRQDTEVFQVRDYNYLAIRKYISASTLRHTKNVLVKQYPVLKHNEQAVAYLVDQYYSGATPTSALQKVRFTFLDNYFQGLPSKKLQRLFPQSIHKESRVKVVPPVRSKVIGSSFLQFRTNLLVRGVLCVLLEHRGHLFVIATVHNIRNQNVMAFTKYLQYLHNTLQFPFFLVGDTNIRVHEWLHSAVEPVLHDSETYLGLPPTVTSKNSKVIDYAVYSRIGFYLKYIDSIPVTDPLSCQSPYAPVFVQRTPFLFRSHHPFRRLMAPMPTQTPRTRKSVLRPKKLFQETKTKETAAAEKKRKAAEVEATLQKTYSSEFVRDHVLLEFTLDILDV